jgi:hypothetical protein
MCPIETRDEITATPHDIPEIITIQTEHSSCLVPNLKESCDKIGAMVGKYTTREPYKNLESNFPIIFNALKELLRVIDLMYTDIRDSTKQYAPICIRDGKKYSLDVKDIYNRTLIDIENLDIIQKQLAQNYPSISIGSRELTIDERIIFNTTYLFNHTLQKIKHIANELRQKYNINPTTPCGNSPTEITVISLSTNPFINPDISPSVSPSVSPAISPAVHLLSSSMSLSVNSSISISSQRLSTTSTTSTLSPSPLKKMMGWLIKKLPDKSTPSNSNDRQSRPQTI